MTDARSEVPEPEHRLPGPPQPARFNPLDFGAVLGQSFSLVWKNPVPLLAVAGVIVWAANLGAGTLAALAQSAAGLDGMSPGGIDGSLVGPYLGALLLQIIAALGAQVIAQGFALHHLRVALLGDRATSAELWRLLRVSGTRLLLVNLVFFGAGVAFAILVTGVMALAFMTLFSSANAMLAAVIAVPVSFVIAAGLGVPFLWLAFRLQLASGVVVFERTTVRHALRRSWELTRGRVWRVAGIQLVISLACGVVGAVLMFIIVVVGVLSSPTSPADTTAALLPGIIGSVPVFAVGAFGAMVTNTAIGLLYVDARFREGWLWTTLNGYAAARISGVPASQLADPFVTPPAPHTDFPGT